MSYYKILSTYLNATHSMEIERLKELYRAACVDVAAAYKRDEFETEYQYNNSGDDDLDDYDYF